VAASLAACGSPSAAFSITSTALAGRFGLVFDRAGDLWMSNSTSNTVVEFSASQLAASGAVTPVVTLSGSAIGNPGRIAFDVYGNLWVPNTASNTVVEFSVSQLGTSASPTPAVTLSSTSASIAGPRAVAFDQQGNLWVANGVGNTFVAFSNSQQTASGSPTPAEILTIPPAVGSPAGFAFDNSGNLWAFGSASTSLIEYSAAQISTGAASQPSFMISVASNPVSFVLDPPPNGLPLVGPQTARRKPVVTPAGRRVMRVRN
jgi:sugar lactone lactonase YvrE